MPSFDDWSTTPAANGTASGVDITEGCPAGNMNGWGREIMAQLRAVIAPIPPGTVMLFAQTTAPTGWTKSTTHDNKALRVVSGTAGSGGTVDFTSASVSGTTDGHALTTAEMPAHHHLLFNADSASTSGSTLTGANYATWQRATGASSNDYSIQGDGTTPSLGLGGDTGGGGAHTHTFTGGGLALKYVDVILASRDA